MGEGDQSRWTEGLRRVRAALVLLFGAVTLAAWLPRALASRWIADDYCFASSSIHAGFWRSQALVYFGASGRYTVAFLYAALTRLGPWIAPLLAILGMIVWIVAACVAAKIAFRLMGAEVSRIEGIAAGVGFVTAVMHAAPTIYQPLIWMGGLFTYGLPIIGSILLIVLVLGRVERSAKHEPSHFLLMAGGAFVLGGCSEVAAVAQVIYCAMFALTFKRARPYLIAAAIGSTLALAIVAGAPGNFQRRELFVPLTVPQALTSALLHAPRILEGILLEGYTLFLPLVIFVALAGRNDTRISRRVVLPAAIAGIGAIAAALFGGLAGTGRLPWGRVQFVPVAYLTLTVFIIALVLRLPVLRRTSIAVALTFVMIIVGIAGIVSSAGTQLQTIREAREFAIASDEMTSAARAERGRAVTVSAPHAFEYLDFIARDPRYWTNRCIAQYYGLTSIQSAPK